MNVDKIYMNWAKNTTYKGNLDKPRNLNELKNIFLKKKKFGIIGNFRSFNDTCINKKKIVSLEKFKKKILINSRKNTVNVTSNVKLIDLLKEIVPKGYMLGVTPGSKYVTIGGMVANNVIGKNTKNNQFKYLISEIILLNQKNSKVIKLTPKKNKKLFDLTIGGFGLTGIILSITLKLSKINNQLINQRTDRFRSINEFLYLNKNSNLYQYSVSWVDSHSLCENKFRGIHYRGNHVEQIKKVEDFKFKNNKMNLIQKLFLQFYINFNFVSKVVNRLFYLLKKKNSLVSFDEFFYPQDKWINFNECYHNGFFQIQFLIQQKKLNIVINEISNFLKKYKIKSTFIILKNMNEKGSNLNFYGKGISISFDFSKDHKYLTIKKFFLNLYIKHEVTINFSKDIISDARFIKKYSLLKKTSFKLDVKRKICTEFSNRLNI
jgi:decaprenylphospho-beta-D-ribofuranose 2-oxidase